MFDKSQHLYDIVYGFKDYAGEAAVVRAAIQERVPAARTLLDVACGTGRHLELFKDRYEVEGLDLDEALLAHARRRNPDVPFHQGDMVDFDLGREFDAVTCLFSSIGYVRTLENLGRAIANMARHVRPGGALIVEPWFSPEDYEADHIDAGFIDEPKLKVARMGRSTLEGRRWTVELQYLVGTSEGIEHFSEEHVLGAFTHDEYLDAFRSAGLEVEHDDKGLMGRGLYIGTRR